MKKIPIFAIIAGAVLVASMLVSNSIFVGADKDDDDDGDDRKKVKAKKTSCDPDDVQHWDKILFTSNGFRTSTQADQPDLFPGEPYDIKIIDDPTRVADVEEEVEKFLIDHGYGDLIIGPDIDPVEIIDIEYAIVCVDP